ncbi:hypothetical protein D8M04_18770 [Oceanobacillus piezotolerans]|uniref:Uncharacterized protein n=1 Tax=Oceanobacillus piezotolerans TaxID=2448030 RepID=A0A498D1F1_9BACI|nr:hypothetical protein [Oceanobacillus piezotolerans]RLL40592.1 hypothetical protein D8M04_18770 [Oceanobacillus piezotolerans]
MPNQKNNRHAIPHKNQVNQLNKENNPYGILKQVFEVDTDVNEDPNRERLLDESVDAFIESKEEQ